MKRFLTWPPRGFFLLRNVNSGYLWTVSLAAAALLCLSGPVQANPIYNTSLGSPGVYYGSGNANEHWVVNRTNGVEIGLQTVIRYKNIVAPTPSLSAIYQVPTGATTATNKTGSAWGFAFSLNLFNAGLTLNDVHTSLQMQDVANGTTGAFDALLIPDNAIYAVNSAGYGFQNAEALSYASIANALGDPGYNMNQNDTYNFLFSVSCNADTECAGQQLASVSSTVIAGTGANAVPEPSGLGMFGLGVLVLLGLGWVERRRVRATDMCPV